MEFAFKNIHKLMQKEVINIEPKLSEIQHAEFLKFCKELKKQLSEKNQEQKEEFLQSAKEKVYAEYGGKNFHHNTDLAFIESLLLDLLLQDWELSINNDKVLLELEVADENEKDLT